MDYTMFSDLEFPRIAMKADDSIILDKLFGPTVFARLRITPMLEAGGWLVERSMANGWVEICVLPAQVEAGLSKDE